MALNEIYAGAFFSQPYREIVISTDLTVSSLADSQSVTSCGCYRFQEYAGGSSFIIWRVRGEWLYLEEHSMDIDLHGNYLAIKMPGCPILPGTAVFEESRGNVQIVVPTVVSVHRFSFPHPVKVRPSAIIHSGDVTLPSIFASIMSEQSLPVSSHMLTQGATGGSSALSSGGGSQQQPHAATVIYSPHSQEVLFGLGCTDGSIMLVSCPPINNRDTAVGQEVLRCSSMLQRLSSWIAKPFARDGMLGGHICDLTFQVVEKDVLLYAITADCRLQVWSCKTKKELLTFDVWKYLPENEHHDLDSVQLSKLHRVKRSVVNGQTYITLFAFSEQESMFIVTSPVFTGGKFGLDHVTELAGLDTTLLDYSLTAQHLITLSVSADNETVVEHVLMDLSSFRHGDWIKAELSLLSSPQAFKEDVTQLTAEEICGRIFNDGFFSFDCVLKSFRIVSQDLYRTVRFGDWTNLRQMAVNYIGLESDEYLVEADGGVVEDIRKKWRQFYSSCLQYHSQEAKPLGLLSFGGDSTRAYSGVIRQSFFTILYPGEDYLRGMEVEASQPIEAGMEALLRCCRLVDEILYAEKSWIGQLERVLMTSETPATLWRDVNSYVKELILPNLNTAAQRLPTLRAVVETVRAALPVLSAVMTQMLAYLDVTPALGSIDVNSEQSSDTEFSQFLTSRTGMEFVARCLREMFGKRLSMCRNLYVLTVLLDQMRAELSLAKSVSQSLSGAWSAQVRLLWLNYGCLRWLSNTSMTTPTAQAIELGSQVLPLLNLLPSSPVGLSETSILRCFFRGESGLRLRRQLARNLLIERNSSIDLNNLGGDERIVSRGDGRMVVDVDDEISIVCPPRAAPPGTTPLIRDGLLESPPCAYTFEDCFASLMLVACRNLWPSGVEMHFPMFLLRNYQYKTMIEYCDRTVNVAGTTRPCLDFIKGVALLNCGQPEEAMAHFLSSYEDLEYPDSLMRLWLMRMGPCTSTDGTEGVEVEDPQDPNTAFVMKVIDIFDPFNLPDYMVKMVQFGLSRIGNLNPERPRLLTKLFRCFLDGGSYSKAFETLQSNPDVSSQRACLRQLLVALLDNNKIQYLVANNYGKLEKEVVDILESRARSSDLETSDLYEILYVFFIKRQSFQRAAHYMLECAMSLGRAEKRTLDGLTRQINSYLAAINSLGLVDKGRAFLVRPTIKHSQKSALQRHSGTIDVSHLYPVPPNSTDKIDLVEVGDLRKELLVVRGLHSIAKADPKIAANVRSQKDLVSGLATVREFDNALLVAVALDLAVEPVLEALVDCSWNRSRASTRCDEDGWLDNNKTFMSSVAPTHNMSVHESAMQLLSAYLRYLGQRRSPERLYDSVARRMMAVGMHLPNWLVAEYKKIDTGSLIRVYTEYGMLKEAQDLTSGLIDGLLGLKPEAYGLKNALHANQPAECLPRGVINHLLSVMESEWDAETQIQFDQLKLKLEQYRNEVQLTSSACLHEKIKRR